MFTVSWRYLLRKPSVSYNVHRIVQTTAICPITCGLGGGTGSKRGDKAGKCRMGFIPDEWFQFFKPKTGVTGPYVFGIVVGNYLISKEKFVMEHEYYLGLSIAICLYILTAYYGAAIGKALDKEVDAVEKDYERGRQVEVDYFANIIKDAKKAQYRAEGQKILMDAKKENVALQLEAEYRERCMMVYRSVKGRMDYHVRRFYTEGRIQQRWMIKWILENVMKSITPEFEQQAMDRAIKDLEAAASKA